MSNQPKTIQAGQTLTARSACDYNCIFSVTVIDRKGQFATVQERAREPNRVKVRIDIDGNEYVMALGTYSMAPIFRP